MMATFLLLRMRMNALLKAGLFTTFLIGLLSFGGRAALGTTLVLLVLAGIGIVGAWGRVGAGSGCAKTASTAAGGSGSARYGGCAGCAADYE